MKAESILNTKAKAFALRIVRLFRYLKGRKESVIAKQVLRSGTSIGANITEGRYAQTRADFATKYSIALKEAAETLYWLELLRDGEFVENSENFQSLMDDCDELIRILTASIKTVRESKGS